MQRSVRSVTVLVAVLASLVLSGALALAPAVASPAEVPGRQSAVPRHTFARLASAETARQDVFEVRGRLTSAPGRGVWLWSRATGSTQWRKVGGMMSDDRTGSFRIAFRGACGTRFRIAVRATRERARTDVYIGRIVCD